MITIKEVNETISALSPLRQEIKSFNSNLSNFKHSDIGVANYLNKAKKLGLQSLDLYGEMEKQLLFLRNELKGFEQKQMYEKQRLEKQKQFEERKTKGV